MRKILLLILGLLVIPLQFLVAQTPKIIGYQYWFDDNDAGIISQSVSPASTLDLNTSVTVPTLPVGFHRFNIRFKDDSLQYSPVSTSMFYFPVSTLINGYEYWFNNDYAGKIAVNVSNTTLLDLSSAISTASLTPGMNIFHIRFRDVAGSYSATSTAYFVIVPEMLISGYEYWFDNDYASKTAVNIANTQMLDLTSVITATSLSLGFHAFHIRFKNTAGTWSSTQSDMFYKHGTGNQNNLISYEYWFDDNAAAKVTVPLANQPAADVVATINAGSVQPGLHKAHMRFRSADFSSVVSSSYFYKSETSAIAQNAVTGYRFWFDNDPSNMRVIALAQPARDMILLDSIELPYLPLGKHLMNVDFRDTVGNYSSIVSDSVDVQNCHPYAAKAITGITQLCKGTNGVVYSTPAITNATGYSWSLPAGATIVSGMNTRTITVNYALNAVTGPISVVGTNPCGSGAASTLLITLNPLPEPVITPNGPTTFCQGGSVVLTASGGIGYLWSNAATTASIAVNSSGNYTVTVTNSFGCSSVISRAVTVNPLPVPAITPNGPTTFCLGGSVVLTASGGTSYQWSSASTNAAITVTSSGNYTVTVTNANGCKNTTSRTVTVNPLPTAVISPGGPTTFCQGGSVVLTASGGTSYQWSNAATNAAITVTSSGNYTVTVTNANGCKNTTSRSVTVNPLPTAVITPDGPTTFCDGESVVLTASGGTSYQWSNAATNAAITATSTGNYTVTVTNANGCKNTISRSVTVNPLPTALITPDGPTTICDGESVVLTASGGTSYVWSNAATTAAVMASESGTYSVTVTNANGCNNGTSLPVTVNPLPIPALNGDTVVCSGAARVSYTTDPGKSGYAWSVSPGGSIEEGQGTNSIRVNWTITEGIQTVSCGYSDASGCFGLNTVNVQVKPVPPDNRTMEGMIVSSGATLCADATDSLFLPGGNPLLVQNGGSAILIAGKMIRLLPTSTVNAGGYLHGYISADCFYCNAVPHTLPQALKDDLEVLTPAADQADSGSGSFFRVYPNPTSGAFTVALNKEMTARVEIYGIHGEKIFNGQITGALKKDFTLNGQPAGMYLIRVQSEGASGTSRIIKYE